MDNKKYNRIAQILNEIKETFGFNVDEDDSNAGEPEGASGGKGSKLTSYEIAPYAITGGRANFATNAAVDGGTLKAKLNHPNVTYGSPSTKGSKH